jgi:hypothetical protein
MISEKANSNSVLNKPNAWAVLVFLLVAGVTRALPHPPNFAPIAAMALFGGAYLTNRRLALLLPLVAMMFSDLLLEGLYQLNLREYSGLHNTMFFVYGSMIAISGIGMLLKNRVKPIPLVAASLSASVLFFLITNFGVYASGLYGTEVTGLLATYVLGIPFFGPTALGDLFFTGVLFGGFELLKSRVPEYSLVRVRARK